MSTVAVLFFFVRVFCLGYKLNTMHQYKCVFCCKFSLLQFCQIFLRSVNNTHNNRKNKKGARFFETQCTFGQKCLVPQSWLSSYAYGHTRGPRQNGFYEVGHRCAICKNTGTEGTTGHTLKLEKRELWEIVVGNTSWGLMEWLGLYTLDAPGVNVFKSKIDDKIILHGWVFHGLIR